MPAHRRGQPARRGARSAAVAEPKPAPGPGRLSSASLALAVVWALLFAPQLAGGRIFVVGDASYLRAFAEFSAERWEQHHQRTHWNPYIFAGLPATASLQDSRPQWLPDVLLSAFDGLHRLPGFPPLAIPLLVHLAGMIAVAALSRRLWSAGTPAMIGAGLTWGLVPGQLVPLAFGQEWLVMSCSFVPIVLLAIVRYASAEGWADRLAKGLGVSLATAGQFLAAHPQLIALTLPLAAVFGIERSRRGHVVQTSVGLALFAALGLAMTAAIWWPAQLYNAHSVRGGAAGTSLGEVAAWSAGFIDLIALAWPWAAGFGGATYWGGLHATEFTQFIGTVASGHGVIGLAPRDANRSEALLLVTAAAISALLALGLNSPIDRFLHEKVPMWSTFRVAVRSLIVAQLAFALLSARGFEYLIELADKLRIRWRVIAGWIAAVAVCVAALLYGGLLYTDAVQAARPQMDANAALAVSHRAALDLGARGLLLATVIVLFTIGARTTLRWRSAAVIALMALDLGVVSVPFLVKATGPLKQIADRAVPEIARRAAADPTARVLDVTRERMYANDWIRWRVHSMTGNHPAVPRQWNETFAAVTRSYGGLCALAIRYVGGVPELPFDRALLAERPGRSGAGPGGAWQGA